MLHTTFNKLHKYGVCIEGYQKLAKSLDGVRKYGKDTPIPLEKIIESNGLRDTIWTFRATIEPSEDLLIEFACRCAEHVLHFYEDKYPTDKRPRLAIEAARVCITDKSPEAAAAWAAAGDAAWAAARAAAWAAAGAAARAAAWAAAELHYSQGRAAARAAAWAAAELHYSQGSAAARDAAWVAWAAWATEEKWQIETLLKLLNETTQK